MKNVLSRLTCYCVIGIFILGTFLLNGKTEAFAIQGLDKSSEYGINAYLRTRTGEQLPMAASYLNSSATISVDASGNAQVTLHFQPGSGDSPHTDGNNASNFTLENIGVSYTVDGSGYGTAIFNLPNRTDLYPGYMSAISRSGDSAGNELTFPVCVLLDWGSLYKISGPDESSESKEASVDTKEEKSKKDKEKKEKEDSKPDKDKKKDADKKDSKDKKSSKKDSNVKEKENKEKGNSVYIYVGGVVLLAAAGSVGYLFWRRKNK